MDGRKLKVVGEDAAARYLERRGYRVLHRNWRIRMGELDLVAMKDRTLVFVEVKARASTRFAEPESSVGRRKQQRLRRLGEAYLIFERPDFEYCRFDVVSVVADMREPRLRHIENAF